jgi:hypothetical protein
VIPGISCSSCFCVLLFEARPRKEILGGASIKITSMMKIDQLKIDFWGILFANRWL